jgi:hypothetical protein
MVYRFINSLPRGWRFKAQRLWMHTHDLRDLFWQQPPTLLFQAAFVVPIVGIVFLYVLVQLSTIFYWLLLAYGGFLLGLSALRFVALHMGKRNGE